MFWSAAVNILHNVLQGAAVGSQALGLAAPAISAFNKYMSSNNTRSTSDLYGMANSVGTNLDPNSSSSISSFQRVAKEKKMGTKDQIALEGMLSDLNTRRDSANKQRGYDGRY